MIYGTVIPVFKCCLDCILPALSPPQVCSHCGRAPGDLERGDQAAAAAKGKLSGCSGCHVAKYCGRECQVAHWKAGHKTDCKELLAATGRR